MISPTESQAPPDTRANAVLAFLTPADTERLNAELECVEVGVKTMLYASGDRIDYVYFPLHGMSSTVVASADGMTVEAISVGTEGATGLPLLFGADSSLLDQVQQIPGIAARMAAGVFCAEMDRRGSLYNGMQRYAQYSMVAMAQTIVCNRLHDVSNRAARWLLQCHDSVEGDTFALTQEYFATMLGVHRPSVTLAAITLQGAGAISYRRGSVTILDRSYLEELACECYAITRAEQDRLLNAWQDSPAGRAVPSAMSVDERHERPT